MDAGGRATQEQLPTENVKVLVAFAEN